MAASTDRARRLRLGQWVALAIACCWGLALPIGAALVPAYSSTSTSSSSISSSGAVTDSTAVTHGSATLLQENGARALLVTAVPLAVALAVAGALWRRSPAKSGAGPLAWTITGLLGAFNLVALLSVGVFMLPVTICLIVACAIHPTAPTAAPGRRGLPGPATLDP